MVCYKLKEENVQFCSHELVELYAQQTAQQIFSNCLVVVLRFPSLSPLWIKASGIYTFKHTSTRLRISWDICADPKILIIYQMLLIEKYRKYLSKYLRNLSTHLVPMSTKSLPISSFSKLLHNLQYRSRYLLIAICMWWLITFYSEAFVTIYTPI
jgi:hypothetical protein